MVKIKFILPLLARFPLQVFLAVCIAMMSKKNRDQLCDILRAADFENGLPCKSRIVIPTPEKMKTEKRKLKQAMA